MAGLTSTATCTARTPVVVATGELIPEAVLVERVSYALDLQTELAAPIFAARYAADGLTTLAAGLDATGRKLPSRGYVALRRLGWTEPVPSGLYVPDRFARCVQEQVARRLRQAVWVSNVVDGLMASWPQNPVKRTSVEWDAVWAACPDKTDKVTVRNRTRPMALRPSCVAGSRWSVLTSMA